MVKKKTHSGKKTSTKVSRAKKEKIDPIYLPIEKDDYKKNKIRLLQTQMKIIDCVGHLDNLQKLKKEKMKLVSELKDMIHNSFDDFATINNAMPLISQRAEFRTTTVTQRINFEKEITVTKVERVAKEEGLDKELREIQEKLNNLGAY